MEATFRPIRVLFRVFLWIICLTALIPISLPGTGRGRDSSRPLMAFITSAICSTRDLCDPVIGTDSGLVFMLGLQDLPAKESRSSQKPRPILNRISYQRLLRLFVAAKMPNPPAAQAAASIRITHRVTLDSSPVFGAVVWVDWPFPSLPGVDCPLPESSLLPVLSFTVVFFVSSSDFEESCVGVVMSFVSSASVGVMTGF